MYFMFIKYIHIAIHTYIWHWYRMPLIYDIVDLILQYSKYRSRTSSSWRVLCITILIEHHIHLQLYAGTYAICIRVILTLSMICFFFLVFVFCYWCLSLYSPLLLFISFGSFFLIGDKMKIPRTHSLSAHKKVNLKPTDMREKNHAVK